jgi:hypothetical protein
MHENTSIAAVKAARRMARELVSPEIGATDDARDTRLLTAVEMVGGLLSGRENIKEYCHWAELTENQPTLLKLTREFDQAITRFNSTAGPQIDEEKYINASEVKSEDKLGTEVIPEFLGRETSGPRRTIETVKAGMKALLDQNWYMANSEDARQDDELRRVIHESGQWSEIHLRAKSPKHFWAMALVDLYPGLLKRTRRYGMDLDTDELVRSVCEFLDPHSELFNLIKEQGWFTSDEFSQKWLDETLSE